MVAFLLALLVTGKIKGRNFFRAGFFIPNLIGGLILGSIWEFVFTNILLYMGKTFVFGIFVKSWLSAPVTAFIAIIVVTIWQLSGYMMLIYIAGLTGVAEELREAAKIDGANNVKTFFKITLPFSSPSVMSLRAPQVPISDQP